MITRVPYTKTDLDRCVEMYCSRTRDAFLPVSCQESFKYLLKMNRDQESLIRIAESDNKVVGFIVGQRLRLAHMDEDIVQQTYFCSDASKILTVRIVRDLHQDLINFAIKQNVRFVLSQGSPVDTSNVFTRILERDGWKREGYLAHVDVTARVVR